MYAQPGLGLLVEAVCANDERSNRGPANLEGGKIARPTLYDRVMLHTGRFLIKVGQRLKTAGTQHMTPSEEMV